MAQDVPTPFDAYADMADLRDQGSLVELEPVACLDLIAEHDLGRLAINQEGGPLVFPVNYAVEGGTVIFRTTMGTKLAAADQRATVSFQVDRIDRDEGVGWSVLIRGRLQEVVRGDELDRLAELDLEPFAGGRRSHWVRVMARSVTGRLIPLDDTADPSEGVTPQA